MVAHLAGCHETWDLITAADIGIQSANEQETP